MGLEDREWWRDERRQQGHQASGDTFRAGAPRSQPEDAGVGEVVRLEQPAKPRTPPSYVHLPAQEILDAPSKGSGAYFWVAVVALAICLNGLAYLYLSN